MVNIVYKLANAGHKVMETKFTNWLTVGIG